MMRGWFFTAVLMFCATAQAFAQANLIERAVTAAPGRDTRVAVYTSIRPDCTSGPLPAIRLVGAPAHGTVTVKRATLKATNIKQCLAIDVPAFAAYYRAASDFTGTDDFLLEVTFTGGRRDVQHFQVSVSNSAGGGQGI